MTYTEYIVELSKLDKEYEEKKHNLMVEYIRESEFHEGDVIEDADTNRRGLISRIKAFEILPSIPAIVYFCLPVKEDSSAADDEADLTIFHHNAILIKKGEKITI
jgi:hypothetical protein